MYRISGYNLKYVYMQRVQIVYVLALFVYRVYPSDSGKPKEHLHSDSNQLSIPPFGTTKIGPFFGIDLLHSSASPAILSKKIIPLVTRSAKRLGQKCLLDFY